MIAHRAIFASLIFCLSTAAAAAPDLSGIYMLKGSRGYGMGDVPDTLTPEARSIVLERIASMKAGRPWADSGVRCLPPGMPRLSLTPPPYPFEIFQTADKIAIVAEASAGVTRYIYLNRGHPNADDLDPTFNGDSVGHWEGDTLVVDTIGLEREKHTIEKNGMPILGDLHIVERIRRVDSGALEVTVTLDDPKTFTSPWTQTVRWEKQPPKTEIKEYICLQNNKEGVDRNGTMGVMH